MGLDHLANGARRAADWGNRYALINHAAGDAAEIVEARAAKLHWTTKNLRTWAPNWRPRSKPPKLTRFRVCRDVSAASPSPSVRQRTPYAENLQPAQVEPKRRQWKEPKVGDRIAIAQGGLEFRGLPDRLGVVWKGQEIFRAGGFHAGGWGDCRQPCDPSRPFVVQITEGIINENHGHRADQGPARRIDGLAL